MFDLTDNSGVELPDYSYTAPQIVDVAQATSGFAWQDALKGVTTTAQSLFGAYQGVKTTELEFQKTQLAGDLARSQLDLSRAQQLGAVDIAKLQTERAIAAAKMTPSPVPSGVVNTRAAAGIGLGTVAVAAVLGFLLLRGKKVAA